MPNRKGMNSLERYRLLKYCDKWGLDPYEIDSKLTYYENMKHLRDLVKMLAHSLDMFEIVRMESQLEEYMDKNALTYYAACRAFGETKSEETGPPDTSPSTFSLKTLTAKPEFSLRALVGQKLNAQSPSAHLANGEQL